MATPDFSTLKRVANAIDTPYFIYHPNAVQNSLRMLQDSLLGWGDSRLAYSVKTNPIYSLLTDVQKSTAWAEVVSVPEFDHVMAVGFSPDQIVFNGPLKASGLSRESLGAACINIDSIEEIELLKEAAKRVGVTVRVGVRVCPPLSAPTWSRFGLNVETGEFEQALVAISTSKQLKLAGLHAHLGTQVNSTKLYLSLIAFLRNLWKTYDFPDDALLDIGGGFPFRHDSLEHQIPGQDFFLSLAEAWGPNRPRLVIEPGRIIAAPSMTLVSRVLSRKKRPREPDILVLDGGTNHNVMGAFFEHAWTFENISDENNDYRLCGPLCMEDDVMSGRKSGVAPKVGSLVMMHNSGAYSFALARNFIQGIPPIIQISDQSFVMISDRRHFGYAYGTHQGVVEV